MKADVILKKYWDDKERFADLFNAAMFDGLKVISAKQLSSIPNEVSNIVFGKNGANSVTRLRDVLAKYQVNDVTLAILGVENQKEVHYAMPLRSLLYDGLTYQKQYDEIAKKNKRKKKETSGAFLSGMTKDDKLKPVISIVLYYGEEPWDGATSLHDLLDIPEGWENFINDYPIHLVEMRNNELEFKNKDNQDFFQLLKIIYDKSISYKERKKTVIEYDEMNDVANEVLLAVTASSDYNGLYRIKNRKEDIDMCELFEAIMQEGKDAGKIEGKIEGKAEQIVKIYQKLNFSKDNILKELISELQISMPKAREYYEMYGMV